MWLILHKPPSADWTNLKSAICSEQSRCHSRAEAEKPQVVSQHLERTGVVQLHAMLKYLWDLRVPSERP